MLFRKGKVKEVYPLVKIENERGEDPVKTLLREIRQNEEELQSTRQAFFQAQIVKLRSIFYQDRNLFDGFQRRMVEYKANSSAEWHQQKLTYLNRKQNDMRIRLDELTGKTWQRKLMQWLRVISLFFTFLIGMLLIALGFFAALYLLPIFIMLIIVFFIMRSINKFN